MIVSWAVPLLHSTDPLRKNDVLVSNLLFLVLLLWLGQRASQWVAASVYASHYHVPATTSWQAELPMLLAFSLVKAGFYYAVRRSILWAKIVVVFACLGLAYADTNWHQGHILGMNFTDLPRYSLLVLVKNLLVLTALVLMFKKPQPALSGT